jgi:hypothetical protein
MIDCCLKDAFDQEYMFVFCSIRNNFLLVDYFLVLGVRRHNRFVFIRKKNFFLLNYLLRFGFAVKFFTIYSTLFEKFVQITVLFEEKTYEGVSNILINGIWAGYNHLVCSKSLLFISICEQF